MRFSGDIFEDSSIEINVTPLIDVIFILLLFFILTTTFVNEQAIKVNLPSAKTATKNEIKKQVYLRMTKDGSIYLEDKKVNLDQLSLEFTTAVKNSNEPSLTLEADAEVNHGSVVKIMDLARENGIKKISIAAKVIQ